MRTTWRDPATAAREGGDGAAVADRVGVRAGGRCAQGADAAASARPRRDAAAVDRSRRRAASARRLGAGAGLRPAGRCVPRISTIRRGSPRSSTLVQALNRDGLLLAYHDVADGGVFATLAEMAFASRCGLAISIDDMAGDPLATLFAEELGAVVQVRAGDLDADACAARGGGPCRACSSGARRRTTACASSRATPCCSTRRASTCIAHGRRRRTRCSGCATTRTPRPRNTTGSWTPATRAFVRASRSIRPTTSRRRSSRRARGRRSRSCASRASTARSKWPRRSIAPASMRTTCT